MLSHAYRDTMATFQNFDNNRTIIHHSNNQILQELERGRRLTHAQSTELMRDVLSAWQAERGMFFQQLRLDQQMIVSLLVVVAGLMYLLGGYQAAYEHLKQQLAVEGVYRGYTSAPPRGTYSYGSGHHDYATWSKSATWPLLVFGLTWVSFSFNLLGFQSLVDSVLGLHFIWAAQVMLLFLLDLFRHIAGWIFVTLVLVSPSMWYSGEVGASGFLGFFVVLLVSLVVAIVCDSSVTKRLERWNISTAVRNAALICWLLIAAGIVGLCLLVSHVDEQRASRLT